MKFAISTKFVGIDRMSGVFKKISAVGGKTAGKISTAFAKMGNKFKSIGDKARKALAFAGITGGIYALKNALEKTIQTGLDFEQTIVNASVKFGASAKPGTVAFKQLQKEALKVGRTTEFTATQSAEALKLLGGAGFTATQSVATLRGMTDLASASQVDMATATDITANSLSIFGLQSKNSAILQKNLAKSTDIMVTAINSAKFEAEDYLETMKMAGPVFKASGRSMAEFATMTAVLAKAGIKGTMAGTVLKNALLNLQAPTKQQSKVIAKMGLIVDDGTGKMRSMTDIIKQISDKTKGWTKIQKANAMSVLFGKRAVAGMMSAVEIGSKSIQDLQNKIENSNGATKQMAQITRDTAQNKIKLMQSAVEGLELAIFTGLKPVIEKITNGIAKFSGKITEFIKQNPVMTKVIGAMAITLTVLTVGIIAVAGAMAVLNLVMMANPIVLIVGGIIIAITALTALIILNWDTIVKYWDKGVANITKALNFLATEFKKIGKSIVAIIDFWVAKFLFLKDFVVSVFSNMGAIIKAQFLTIGSILLNTVLSPVLKVMGIINAGLKMFGGKGIDSKISYLNNLKADFAKEAEASRGEAVGLVSSGITNAQETRKINENIQNNTTTNKLVIEDKTGQASLDNENDIFQLNRTLVSQ